MAEKDKPSNPVASTPEIERYLTIWEKDPRSRVFAPLAEAYRKIGEIDRAIEVCQRGLQIHPNYVSGRVALGRAYFDKGDLKDAKAQLEIIYEADPENLVAAKTLGEIFEAEGDLEKALLCYRLAHYSTPSATEIVEKIANVERALKAEANQLPAAEPEKAVADKEAPAEKKEEVSGFEAARKALRRSEAEAAGEAHAEEDEESESDLRQEIERLRRVPERFLMERDDLEEATDEFFAKAELSRREEFERQSLERKKELAAQSLTELMLRQGYTQRAVKVYEEYLLSDPSNEQAKQRIRELKVQLGDVENEIHLRQGEEAKQKEKESVDPAVIDSLMDWLKRVK